MNRISMEHKMNRTGDKLVTWTATGEPNWSYIPSAGKSSKTKEQFVSEIKNLAQKAAKTENKAESDAISRQVLTLRAEYLSDVAPNRKLLYQQAKTVMQKGKEKKGDKPIGELTLLDFLQESKAKGNLAEKLTPLGGGGVLNQPILSTGGYGADISYQGTLVLSNTGVGWGYGLTPKEQEKSQEFYAVYWREYRAVKAENKEAQAVLPDYLETRQTFDQKA